jgi:hypothetical protein
LLLRLTFASGVSHELIAFFAGTPISDGKVNTLLVASTADAVQALAAAFVDATQGLWLVGPVAAVVLTVANPLQGDAHFPITTAIKFRVGITSNFRIAYSGKNIIAHIISALTICIWRAIRNACAGCQQTNDVTT